MLSFLNIHVNIYRINHRTESSVKRKWIVKNHKLIICVTECNLLDTWNFLSLLYFLYYEFFLSFLTFLHCVMFNYTILMSIILCQHFVAWYNKIRQIIKEKILCKSNTQSCDFKRKAKHNKHEINLIECKMQ